MNIDDKRAWQLVHAYREAGKLEGACDCGGTYTTQMSGPVGSGQDAPMLVCYECSSQVRLGSNFYERIERELNENSSI